MSRSLYAYCPNPGCAFLHSRTGQSQTAYAADLGDPGCSTAVCPHCQTVLRTTCPGCGQNLHARPQRYCPTCGVSLLPAPPAAPCTICGRPVRRESAGSADFSICSEQCLRVFIQSHVKVCDQCGRRFTVQCEAPGALIGLRFPGNEDHPCDFCSQECCKEYAMARSPDM